MCETAMLDFDHIRLSNTYCLSLTGVFLGSQIHVPKDALICRVLLDCY